MDKAKSFIFASFIIKTFHYKFILTIRYIINALSVFYWLKLIKNKIIGHSERKLILPT